MLRSPPHLLRTALLAALLLLAGPAFAQQTSLSVNLPEVVILHYYSSIELSVEASELRALLLQGADETVDEGTATVLGLAPDLNIDPEGTVPVGPEDPRLVPLILENAFAVRSLSVGGQTRVTGSILTSRSNHPATNASRIIARRIRLDLGGPLRQAVTIGSPGLLDPTIGGIHLALDLRNTRLSGSYTGITIQLSVENL